MGWWLKLSGQADASNRELLREAVDRVLAGSVPVITVQLADLTFIDCSALSVLTRTQALLAAQGNQLVLSGARPTVRRLISLLSLDVLLDPAEREAQSAS